MSCRRKPYSNQNQPQARPSSRQRGNATSGPSQDPLPGLRSDLDAIGAGTAVLDQAGTILLVDQNWQRLAAADGLFLFGCRTGRNLLEICDSVEGRSAKLASEIAAVLRSVAANHRDRFEAQYTFDSPVAKCSLTIQIKRLNGTEADRIIVSVALGTPHPLAEETLRESEERFRQMADNIQEIFWMLDAATNRVIYVSPAYEAICGRTCESLYEAPLSYREVIHPQDQEHVLSRLDELVRAGEFDEEFRIVRPDGEVRWVWARGFPIRDGYGRIYRLAGTAQDITARKHTEAALRESDDRYRDLVEHSEDLLCTHDLSGHLLSVNEPPARILGYEVGELLQKPMSDFLAPEFRSQFDDYLNTVQRDGFAKGSMVVLTRTGERRIWEYHNTLRTKGVASPLVRGVAHDVTERKKAERALRFSEAKFSKAFRSSPSAMAITTVREGRFVDVNESFERQSGYQRSEVIGRTSLELGIWADPVERAAIVGQLEKHGGLQNLEVKLRTKFGHVIIVMYSAEIIEVNGEQCVLASGEDITARKKTEEALRRSEADYRSLFEGAPYGILRSTPDGKVLMVNPALQQILGYESEAELLTTNLVTEICLSPAEGILALNKYSNAERFEEVELHWKRKDGTPILVRAYGRPVRNEHSAGAFLEIMVEDLTQRHALEEQLRQSQKMQAVTLLAGGIAHDFNTLLTGILGYGEQLLMAANLPHEARRQAEGIAHAALQARSLTRQLLALGRRQILRPKVLDLNALISDVEELLRRLVGDSIGFVIDLAPNLGGVKADPGQLTQVIMNLVVNARDAMPEGGELTIKTLTVNLAQPDYQLTGIDPGQYAVLAVIDTGCGMDEATQARIFEPFFTTKPQGRGTGLGLSTVYGIIEQSGGDIRVSSRPGQGTAFTIYFPCTDEPVERTQARDFQGSPAEGCATVLVVEDDDLARRLTCEFLEGHGYTVLKARDAADALNVGRKCAGVINLLLTDVVLPGMSGQELAEHLSRLHPEMKVLYMTGYADTLTVATPTTRDIVPLEKPFLRHELMSRVHQALGQEGKRLTQPS